MSSESDKVPQVHGNKIVASCKIDKREKNIRTNMFFMSEFVTDFITLGNMENIAYFYVLYIQL